MARSKCNRCARLESIILDIHWLARRYANGRCSYAPSVFNRAMDEALALDLPLKADVTRDATYYADDGRLGVWVDGTFVKKEKNSDGY